MPLDNDPPSFSDPMLTGNDTTATGDTMVEVLAAIAIESITLALAALIVQAVRGLATALDT